MKTFRALRIHELALANGQTTHGQNRIEARFEDLALDALTPGEVVIDVEYSGINYKDALAATGAGRILRKYPLVGGIDLAGRVRSSDDARFKAGDAVLVTGSGLSEGFDGGYAEVARVRAESVIAMPPGLDSFRAMALGTAGFTAALALLRMSENRQHPGLGPIAVTGASGGGGSLAVDIFSAAGYEVHAISGKPEQAAYLKAIGASQVIGRDALATTRPLESERFGGGLDNVGGSMLASLLAQTVSYGNVASAGLAASHELSATVMPFILRGVSLLGVASTSTARDIREEVWRRLASDWKPRHLDLICTREVRMDGLPGVFDGMLAGGSHGRTLVTL
jgi:putative YhdH/YhfP family quinone oxidoreductase